MLGLDDSIASLSDGTSLSMVIAVAILLGLRHATDPDHLAAVTTLVAGGSKRSARAAGRLGLAWGLGHATTLLLFGLPIVLFNRFLPEPVQQAAEAAIALVIVFLALRLLHRWRNGVFHVHEHEHDGHQHAHAHSHSHSHDKAHDHLHRPRSTLGAYGIGLVHGVGGSAGVGVLILASIDSTSLAVVALALLAIFTAVSMTALTSGFGLTLVSRPLRTAFDGLAPTLGTMSLGFGVWYGFAAFHLLPAPFG